MNCSFAASHLSRIQLRFSSLSFLALCIKSLISIPFSASQRSISLYEIKISCFLYSLTLRSLLFSFNSDYWRVIKLSRVIFNIFFLQRRWSKLSFAYSSRICSYQISSGLIPCFSHILDSLLYCFSNAEDFLPS